jgi:hypothetical protein
MATGEKSSTLKLFEFLTGAFGVLSLVLFVLDAIPSIKYDINELVFAAFGSLVTATATISAKKRGGGDE